jgi:hypothetical protein
LFCDLKKIAIWFLISYLFSSIPYLPSGRVASSSQRSCVWRNLTSFDGTSQGCLCGDFSFVLSFGGSKRKDIEVEKLLSSIDVPDKKYKENTLL